VLFNRRWTRFLCTPYWRAIAATLTRSPVSWQLQISSAAFWASSSKSAFELAMLCWRNIYICTTRRDATASVTLWQPLACGERLAGVLISPVSGALVATHRWPRIILPHELAPTGDAADRGMQLKFSSLIQSINCASKFSKHSTWPGLQLPQHRLWAVLPAIFTCIQETGSHTSVSTCGVMGHHTTSPASRIRFFSAARLCFLHPTVNLYGSLVASILPEFMLCFSVSHSRLTPDNCQFYIALPSKDPGLGVMIFRQVIFWLM
jgi:hypothetical protein